MLNRWLALALVCGIEVGVVLAADSVGFPFVLAAVLAAAVGIGALTQLAARRLNVPFLHALRGSGSRINILFTAAFFPLAYLLAAAAGRSPLHAAAWSVGTTVLWGFSNYLREREPRPPVRTRPNHDRSR